MKKSNLMMQLKPKFQREIFQKVINKYGSSFKAEQYLKTPASSIRSYKNLYFNTVPKNLIETLIHLKVVRDKELKLNLIKMSLKKDIMNKSLDLGRKKRKAYFYELKADIPVINEIIKGNKLFVFKWFEKYQKLLNSGFRKISVENKIDLIIISYKNFTRK